MKLPGTSKSLTETKSEIGSVMKKGADLKRIQAGTMKPCQKTKPEFVDKKKSTSQQTGNPGNCRNCGCQLPPKQCPAFGKEYVIVK